MTRNKAQNLVPNSSFELHSDCSNIYGYNALNWCSSRNGTSTGYLNPCQSDSYARAPRQYSDACFQSYQTVRTGVAYSEFGIYTQSPTQQESSHPQVKLTDTLETGKIYCVTYYVSMWNNAKYSIDKLGALLTPTPFPCFVAGCAVNRY